MAGEPSRTRPYVDVFAFDEKRVNEMRSVGEATATTPVTEKGEGENDAASGNPGQPAMGVEAGPRDRDARTVGRHVLVNAQAATPSPLPVQPDSATAPRVSEPHLRNLLRTPRSRNTLTDEGLVGLLALDLRDSRAEVKMLRERHNDPK